MTELSVPVSSSLSQTRPRGPLAATRRPAGPPARPPARAAPSSLPGLPALRSPRGPERSCSRAAQIHADLHTLARQERLPAPHTRPRLRRGDVSSRRPAARAQEKPVPGAAGHTCGRGASCAPEAPSEGGEPESGRRRCPGIGGLESKYTPSTFTLVNLQEPQGTEDAIEANYYYNCGRLDFVWTLPGFMEMG